MRTIYFVSWNGTTSCRLLPDLIKYVPAARKQHARCYPTLRLVIHGENDDIQVTLGGDLRLFV